MKVANKYNPKILFVDFIKEQLMYLRSCCLCVCCCCCCSASCCWVLLPETRSVIDNGVTDSLEIVEC